MALHGRRAAPVQVGALAQQSPGTAGRPRGGGAGGARPGGADEESIYKLLTEGRREAPRKGFTPVTSAKPSAGGGAGTPKPGAPPRMHQNSSQIAQFIAPDQAPKRPSKVDYTRANRVAVKDASAMNHVKKMHDAAERENQHPGRRNSRVSSGRERQGMAAPGTCFGKPQGPVAAPGRPHSTSKDYVRMNKVAAAHNRPAPMEQRPSEHEQAMKKGDYGRVPAYLKARQQEMRDEAEAQVAAAEAAKIPPGMRMMPEDERHQTLAILAQNKAAVEAKIMQLPFNIETPSQLKYKAGLEARLQEIEEAERLFSRPNVLVHI